MAIDGRIQQAVEARTAHTESVAEETVVSKSAVFEGRIVSTESVAAVEKLADN